MVEDAAYAMSLGFLFLAFVLSWRAARNIAKRGLSDISTIGWGNDANKSRKNRRSEG
jgi:hypothetical protein